MNVLIISPFFAPNVGGVETHLTDLTNYLAKKGHQTFVLTYQPLTTNAHGKPFEKRRNLSIKRVQWFGRNIFHHLEKYPLLEFFYLTPRLFFTSFLFLLKNKKHVDVIHAHGMNAAFIVKVLSFIFKKRAVVSLHAIYNFREHAQINLLYRWTLKSFDKILTLSHASRKELEKIGIPKEKLGVYTYWINQDIFRPLPKEKCRSMLGLNHSFIVLFVGRLIRIKGADILLEVAKRVEKDIAFVFIGTGPEEKTVKLAVDKNKNIFFVGNVENMKLPPYYSAADVFIIPSTYEEGFGRVILEALSCGVPIIGSRRGGIPEAVTEEVGILVEPTVENFQAVISDLFHHKEKLKKLAKSCRVYAEKKFGESNAKIIEKSYTN